MEHLQHFGLTRDPFSNEPDLRFYFESGSHHDAQRRVERGLRQHKGLTVLTGDGGMGKSLLARRILETLEEEVFESTLLTMLPGAADAASILQRFARQIGAPEPAADRAELLSQIYEQLSIVREDGRHAVLMIDDAQIMAPAVLSELGGLLSLDYEDKRLLSMLLVGSPELDKLVENDAGMKPRVDVRVRLQALDLVNTEAYVKHRLASVSGLEGLVSTEAIETLHKFGRGRPRLINTLADNALFETYLGGRLAIEPMDVERAAGDLGIGPDPGTTFSPHHRPVPPPPAIIPPATPASPMVEAKSEPAPKLEPELEASPEPVSVLEVAPAFDVDDLLAEVATAAPELAAEESPVKPSVAAPLASVVISPPAFSLDQDEAAAPIAEFDLTSEIPVVPDPPMSPTHDLEEGLEAALADFEVPEEGGAPSLSLVPNPSETELPEFQFEAPAELNLEDSFTRFEADLEVAEPETHEEVEASERPLPPVAEVIPSLERVPEADSEEAELDAESFAALPPAVDLMAEAEALEKGGPPSAEDVLVDGLEGLDFDLEPVTTPPETKIALSKEPILEMELEDPLEHEELDLETDLRLVEAEELTPLEVDSAEEFDDGLFVELLEE